MKERERKHFYTTTTPDELSIGELMYRAKVDGHNTIYYSFLKHATY